MMKLATAVPWPTTSLSHLSGCEETVPLAPPPPPKARAWTTSMRSAGKRERQTHDRGGGQRE
jgi:hypothetical protein